MICSVSQINGAKEQFWWKHRSGTHTGHALRNAGLTEPSFSPKTG